MKVKNLLSADKNNHMDLNFPQKNPNNRQNTKTPHQKIP